jgi:hypothetical protein
MLRSFNRSIAIYTSESSVNDANIAVASQVFTTAMLLMLVTENMYQYEEASSGMIFVLSFTKKEQLVSLIFISVIISEYRRKRQLADRVSKQ